jgi:diaphanous 1
MYGSMLMSFTQPFTNQVGSGVEALKKMTTTLEHDLKNLFAYFGENPDSPEALKSEDFFAMICSFSSSLQASRFLV